MIPVDLEHPLRLASGSPRRRELLQGVGIPLVVNAFEVDEQRRDLETVEAYLERIASAKLDAAFAGLSLLGASCGALAADTVVVLDGEALGKPADARDAARMISSLAGRVHEVRTRFAIGIVDVESRESRELVAQTVTTRVHFRPLGADAIDRYVATGEGIDKAGAYAIQGIGAFAVKRIEGSYSNVVGLPVCEVIEALLEQGLLTHFPLSRA